MNQVLMKFFKLPPAVRMMLALAGFGSLASIVFFLLPALRSREAKFWLIIGLIIIGVLVGIILLIRWLFKRKKTATLEGALESQGPTRGDIAEQEQIYKEKFKSKLSELRSNGLSVYKLPWFVLMGEPGCGKTATLINSGLDFPLGKDEVPGFGGTRNYNWWFTNDAVILDTAGRIAFQEEGTTDKVEWEYFIKLLKLNRPRCPINGIVVAIPADKLLRDTSEERAQKATVLRERLRQVHQLLGVRFPTFVIVTKMDLVGGFSEFFDEIRPDLQQRNQMFGWSRPDEFQSPYDPAAFTGAFDNVYDRLRNWAMRYLQRPHATEEELGMVVTFPESFRQLRGPLNDYIGTIFQKSPLLEPPFFRGFYFTSSVQEGAPIFDVLARTRAGSVDVRPSKAVDSKAFFIHDFYQNKVFPEQGLVFRSAKHVTLNKRMRRFVWIGSSALGVILLTFFIFGFLGFKRLLDNPKADVNTASAYIVEMPGKAEFSKLAENTRIAQELAKHVDAYDGFWNALTARLMFVFANSDVPQGYVGQVHAKYVLVSVFEPTIREFARRLESGALPGNIERDVYLKGLEQYTRWFGETVGEETWNEGMTANTAVTRAEQYRDILAALDGPGKTEKESARLQVERALKFLAYDRVFGADVLKPHVPTLSDPAALVRALDAIEAFYKPYANVNDPQAGFTYWTDLFAMLGEVRKRYDEVLGLASRFGADFQGAAEEFGRQTRGIRKIDDYEVGPGAEKGTFTASWFSLSNFLKDRANDLPQEQGRVLRLNDLFARKQKLWDEEFGRVERALAVGSPKTDRTGAARVYDAIAAHRRALSDEFAASLKKLRDRLSVPGDGDPLAYYEQQKLLRVSEAGPDARDKTASISLAPEAFGDGGWLKNVIAELNDMAAGAEAVARDLEDLSKWPTLIQQMRGRDPADIGSGALGTWFGAVKRETEGDTDPARTQKVVVVKSGLHEGQTFWEPNKLYDASGAIWNARRDLQVGTTLRGMAKALKDTDVAVRPGLARLRPGFEAPTVKLPYEVNRFNRSQAAAPAPREAEPKPQDPGDLGLRAVRPSAAEETPVGPGETRTDTEKYLRTYHTRDFLVETLRHYIRIKDALKDLPFSDEGVGASLDTAAGRYIDAYFTDWYGIYRDYTRLLPEELLEAIDKAGDPSFKWPAYHAEVTRIGRSLERSLYDRAKPLLDEAVFTFLATRERDPVDDQAWKLIEGRLATLATSNKSLPHILLRQFDSRADTADRFLSELQKAWRTYVEQVNSFGTLSEGARPGATIPDVDALRKGLVAGAPTLDTSFPFVAPLVRTAEYGNTLLRYQLETTLADMIKPLHGHYPIVQREDIPNPNSDEVKLRAAVESAVDPQKFLAMLRDVAKFEKTYGQVYRAGGTPAGEATLAKCAEWGRFLYGDQGAPDADPPAAPNKIGVNVVPDPNKDNRPRDTVNPGAYCEKVCVALPVLDGRGRDPAGDICVSTRGDVIAPTDEKSGWDYRWQLAVNGGFKEARAWMAQVKVQNWKEGQTAWTLPASPWSLPLLVRSQENDVDPSRVVIPVVFSSGGQQDIGMSILIQFDGRFPGPIPPLAEPAPLPGMPRASEFLTRKSTE